MKGNFKIIFLLCGYRYISYCGCIDAIWYIHKMRNVIVIKLFKRQLHVSFVVLIIYIFAPVMHGQKISKFQAAVLLLVFQIMLYKNRYLK